MTEPPGSFLRSARIRELRTAGDRRRAGSGRRRMPRPALRRPPSTIQRGCSRTPCPRRDKAVLLGGHPRSRAAVRFDGRAVVVRMSPQQHAAVNGLRLVAARFGVSEFASQVIARTTAHRGCLPDARRFSSTTDGRRRRMVGLIDRSSSAWSCTGSSSATVRSTVSGSPGVRPVPCSAGTGRHSGM